MQEFTIDQLLSAVKAASKLDVSKSTFLRKVKNGEIPQGKKLGIYQQSPRRWKMSDIQKYIVEVQS